MPQAFFRFYEALNDLLPKDKQRVKFQVNFSDHETVKHIIESLGIPHTEVSAILVNGVSVDFSTRLKHWDKVEVYPGSETPRDTPIIHLQPSFSAEARFILDGHLGKLASNLRLLGFDTLYQNDIDDDKLAEISEAESRILLTRDRGLLKRSNVKFGYCIRAKSPKEQTIEVLRRYKLGDKIRLFARCSRCNGMLNPVSKSEICDRLEPKTQLYFDEFQICGGCAQIYWKGSHFKQLKMQLQQMIDLSK
jgi:uncharacterized protein with PIN domain